MRETLVSSKETTLSRIKGKKQVSDLTNSFQLISDKFHKYEKDRKDELIIKTKKDELIIKLQMQVMELTDKVSNHSVQVDKQEQNSK